MEKKTRLGKFDSLIARLGNIIDFINNLIKNGATNIYQKDIKWKLLYTTTKNYVWHTFYKLFDNFILFIPMSYDDFIRFLKMCIDLPMYILLLLYTIGPVLFIQMGCSSIFTILM